MERAEDFAIEGRDPDGETYFESWSIVFLKCPFNCVSDAELEQSLVIFNASSFSVNSNNFKQPFDVKDTALYDRINRN